MRIVETGNHVVAWAVRLARVDVIPAYPITPQSPVVELISRFIDSGEMDCEYIPVESEHSVLAAMVGAASMGTRTFSATSSHGLVYAYEVLHWAAGARLPMVLGNVNRALGPGWNIWCDHQDSLSARDTGWIQFYCASHQELMDTTIQAFRISEDPRVMLPVMVCYDAFTLSHTYMQVDLPDQEKVDDFLPPFRSMWRLDVDCPVTHGPVVFPDDYEEMRYSIQEGMQEALVVVREVAEEYRRKVGGFHGALLDLYRMEDAEYAVLAMGTLGSEARVAVDMLREEGYPCGVVRIRCYRPFPLDELRELLSSMKAVLVFDRAVSFGLEGILSSEVRSALHGHASCPVFGVVAGLGGRDVTYVEMAGLLKMAAEGMLEKRTYWPLLRLSENHMISRKRIEELRGKAVPR